MVIRSGDFHDTEKERKTPKAKKFKKFSPTKSSQLNIKMNSFKIT